MLEAETRIEPAAHESMAPVMDDWLKAHGIDHRTNPLKFNNYRGEKFTEDGQTLTRGEIMSAWMDFQEPNNKESRLNGSGIEHRINPDEPVKISEETFNKFFAHLSPEEIAMMKDVAAKQLRTAGDLRGKDFEARYGYPMPRVENYWTKYVMKPEGASYAHDLEALQQSNRWIRADVNEAHSVERTGSTAPTYLRDFFEQFQESMNDTALVTTMAKSVEEAAKVLYNAKISDRMAKGYGKPLLNMMRDDLKAMAGQRETPQGWQNAMDGLGNLTTTINLAMNIKSSIKQAMLGLRSVIEYAHPIAAVKALADLALHPKGTRDMAEAISNLYNTSLRRGGTLDQAQMLRQEGSLRKITATRTMLKKTGMWLNKRGTQLSFKIDTVVAKRQSEIEFANAEKGQPFSDDFKAATGLNERDAAGMSATDKLKAAGKFADYIIGETHATSLRGQQAGIQKWAPTRLLTKFKSEPIKAFEVVRRSIMQAHRNPTPGNIVKAVRVTTFYAAVEGAMFYGLDAAWNALFGSKKGTQKQREQRAPKLLESEALTNANYLLGAGDVAQEVLSRTKYPTAPAGNVAGQVGSLTAQMFTSLARMNNERATPRARQTAQREFWDAIEDLGLGSMNMSIRTPRKIYRALTGKQ